MKRRCMHNIQPFNLPENQTERDAAMRDLFKNVAQQSANDLPEEFRGGRENALNKLNQIRAVEYGKSRNYLNGSVTHLSPYLRHGCITLEETVNFVQAHFGLKAEKLLFELAWREYWRNVWYANGEQILHDLAAPKVQLGFNPLPEELKTANTGLPCMDAFIQALNEKGYLHNHARMWLASYLVHWRNTDWRQAADWMHHLLLDGDYASNHLSWQWVASTFSSKPYFFNKENLAKYSLNQFCEKCTAKCPFDDSYSNLEKKLFQSTVQAPRRLTTSAAQDSKPAKDDKTIVWIHDEMLNPVHPLMDAPHEKIFIFDPNFYQAWSILRLQFIADCLAQIPKLSIWVGVTSEVFAHLNVQKIISQQTPNTLIKAQAHGYQVEWVAEKNVSSAASGDINNLSSFSKFWKIASQDFLKRNNGLIRFVYPSHLYRF